MESILVPIALLAVGVAALFIEAFVPSHGAITLVGLASVAGSVALAFLKHETVVGVIFLILALFLAPASLIAAFSIFPRTRLGKRLILHEGQTAESGYVAQDPREQELIGKTGVALSVLRPSGAARIDGRRHDVMTEGEMIAKGAAIEVRQVEGNRIVVREVRTPQTSA